MSVTKSTHFWKGRRLRTALYAVGALVAVTVAGLARTSPNPSPVVHSTGRATADLTGFAALTIAPIAGQGSNVGVPAVSISPAAVFAQPAHGSVLTWTATGLPPGISISGTSGLLAGTPTKAGTFPVVVVATAGSRPPTTASQAFTWFVGDKAPLVTRVTPDAGGAGKRIVISGTNLLAATSVHFGSVSVAAFRINKRGTAIVVHAPAVRPGVVDVTVTSAAGTRAPVAAGRFTAVPPTITAVSTHAGPVTGGTRVRITGTGLAGATAVRFGNVLSREFAVHHGGNLVTAVAPAGAAGTVAVEVITPAGVASTRGGNGFTYRAHVPGARTSTRAS